MTSIQRLISAAAWLAIPFALAAVPARAQTTWNGSGDGLWTTAGNWLPSGTPTSSSIVEFTPAAGEVNPSVTGSNAISRLRIANTPAWGNWTFSGGGSLVAHGGSNAFVVSGLGTTTLDGVSLAGSGTAADLRLGYGNGLELVNSASATTLIGGTTNGISLAGGRLTIDRSAGGTATVTVSGSTVPVNLGGGTLMVKAAPSAASTFAIGGNLQANGQPGTIWLANNASARTSVSFDSITRAGTRFVVENGTLGGAAAADPRVTFTTTPNTFNGIISAFNGSAGPNGYAIISNAAGTQAAFANYVSTSGTGVVAATTTAVSGTLSTNQSANARLAGSGTVASSGTVEYNSLTIQPSAAGQSLTIGSGGVLSGGEPGGVANALPVLLTGSHDFSITGGTFGQGTTHYMWVSNPERTLTIGSRLRTGFFAKLGPGTIALTGTLTDMQTKGLGVSEGVLRVTAANLGMTGSDPGVFFQGTGVLEYDLTTGSGDVSFTKGLSNNAASSALANAVSWTFTRVDGTNFAAPRGASGGFSAMSTNANSRNLVIAIGGTSSPTALVWGGTSGFVFDGSALKFGSPTSTNTVVWKNAIALDSGSPTTYEARVIEVTAGTAGGAADHTRIDGAITGSAATELIKAGNGTLVLAASNGYLGGTTVAAGRLVVNGSIASSNGVRVVSGAELAGSGTAAAIAGGGLVAPGNSPGILTAPSADLSGGLDFAFEFTQTGAPAWGSATNSGNDVLRLTDPSAPLPGTATAGNVFNIYFATAEESQSFLGGVFTDRTADFNSLLTGATFNYFVRDAGGAFSYGGFNYAALAPGDVTRSTVQVASANFTGGAVTDGYTMQFVIVPEPGGLALAGFGGFAAWLIRRGLGPKRSRVAAEC